VNMSSSGLSGRDIPEPARHDALRRSQSKTTTLVSGVLTIELGRVFVINLECWGPGTDLYVPGPLPAIRSYSLTRFHTCIMCPEPAFVLNSLGFSLPALAKQTRY
jgi:hypothetical protein